MTVFGSKKSASSFLMMTTLVHLSTNTVRGKHKPNRPHQKTQAPPTAMMDTIEIASTPDNTLGSNRANQLPSKITPPTKNCHSRSKAREINGCLRTSQLGSANAIRIPTIYTSGIVWHKATRVAAPDTLYRPLKTGLRFSKKAWTASL